MLSFSLTLLCVVFVCKYAGLGNTVTYFSNNVDYAETNQLNAPKIYTSLFTYTMAPTCCGKTMPSSESDYFSFLSHFSINKLGDKSQDMMEPTYRRAVLYSELRGYTAKCKVVYLLSSLYKV
jgi:hypothetical protein